MKTKKFNPGKWYTIYYSQKGVNIDLGFIAVKSRSITEAKRVAKGKIHTDLSPKMGAIQKNEFMKKIKLYTK